VPIGGEMHATARLIDKLTFIDGLKNRWPHPDAPLQQRGTTMRDPVDPTPQTSRCEPWNKGN